MSQGRPAQQARCREFLFNLHLPLARALARYEFRRRPPHGLDRQDFKQLAISGLLEAVDRFDPLRGAPFAVYARRRIRGAIADGIAQSSESGAQYSHRRRLELDRLQSMSSDAAANDPISELSDIAVGLAIGLIAENAARDAALSPYETSAWRDIEHHVAHAIEQLPAAERSVMTQHYTHGVAFTEIAALLGVSKGRVSQLHRSAIARIRKRIAGAD